MQKKEMKGYVMLALSIGLILNACGPKANVQAPAPIQKQTIESIQPGDINIPGIDDPAATADPNAVEDPNAVVDPNATDDPAATANPAVTPATTATVDPNATATPVPTATATTDPSATASPTPTVTATPTSGPTATSTPTAVPTATIAPTPTATPTATPIPDALGNQQLAILAEGNIYQPRGIDVRNGKIYISDYDNGVGAFNNAEGEIKILDTGGNIIKTIQGATFDTLPGELNGAVSDGFRVWIVNRIPYASSQNNIYSFNTDGGGRQNAKIGLTGEAGTNFQDMAINPSTQTLYIASAGNQAIIKINYDANGVRIDTQQLKFNGTTAMTPAGLGVDDSGNVYVTNSNNSSILKFSSTGTKLLEFNSTGKNGTGPTATGIGDIAFDPRNGGMIYVLATVNSSKVILRYDASGNYVRTFGSGLQDPRGMAISADGTIYITDFAKNAIHQYAPGK